MDEKNKIPRDFYDVPIEERSPIGCLIILLSAIIVVTIILLFIIF